MDYLQYIAQQQAQPAPNPLAGQMQALQGFYGSYRDASKQRIDELGKLAQSQLAGGRNSEAYDTLGKLMPEMNAYYGTDLKGPAGDFRSPLVQKTVGDGTPGTAGKEFSPVAWSPSGGAAPSGYSYNVPAMSSYANLAAPEQKPIEVAGGASLMTPAGKILGTAPMQLRPLDQSVVEKNNAATDRLNALVDTLPALMSIRQQVADANTARAGAAQQNAGTNASKAASVKSAKPPMTDTQISQEAVRRVPASFLDYDPKTMTNVKGARWNAEYLRQRGAVKQEQAAQATVKPQASGDRAALVSSLVQAFAGKAQAPAPRR